MGIHINCLHLFTWYLFAIGFIQNEPLFISKAGEVDFKSNAPLELIQASSKELAGVIDPVKYTFAFTIPINSFDGFNSALQKEHFRENYLETHKYPNATFKGKIIETIDWSTNKKYKVRAKGIFNIHGIENERIIKCDLIVNDNSLQVNSSFFIQLKDHEIQVPRVVNQKIAESIMVEISAEFIKR